MNDLHLEIKLPFTEKFNAYGGSPFHVNVGLGYRFSNPAISCGILAVLASSFLFLHPALQTLPLEF